MARRKKARNGNVVDLATALINNGKAMEEGPKRRRWTIHDLKQIKPLTTNQEAMFYDFFDGKNVFAYGSAGTGKTYIALFLALNEMLNQRSGIDRVIIVRSTVATRDIGFMPGTLDEKVAVYERPYKDMFADLIGRLTSYDDMKAAGKVEFITTSFIRGLTWDNAVIVVDEIQNMTFHEIDSIMTRVGENSRIIAVGDLAQTDLTKKNDQSGIERTLRVVQRMNEFGVVHFTRHDIVRSDFVKSWIVASEETS